MDIERSLNYKQETKAEVKNQNEKVTQMLDKIPVLQGKKLTLDKKIQQFKKIADMYLYEKNAHPEFQEIAKALEMFTHVGNEVQILGSCITELPRQKNFSKIKSQFSQIDTQMRGMAQTFNGGKILSKVALGEISSVQKAKNLRSKMAKENGLSQKELSLVIREYTQDRKVLGSLTSSLEMLMLRAAKVLANPKGHDILARMLKENDQVAQNMDAMKNIQRSVTTAWRSSLMNCIGVFGADWMKKYGCFRIADGIVQRRHPGKSLGANNLPVPVNNMKRTSEFATPNLPVLLASKGIKPGAVIWVQSAPGCDADSLGRNGVRNHWFTFSGYNAKGEPLFVDQGRERTIDGFGWCRNRFVHRIYQA